MYSEDFSFYYMNKIYPFNLALFQKYSSYNLQPFLVIPNCFFLLSDEDNFPNLSAYSIHSFIDYCQNKNTKLDQSNALPIYFLSKKYKVESLTKKVEKYITDHKYEVIDEYLSKVNERNDFNSKIEELISFYLSDYFYDDRLFSIPLSSMHRILSMYISCNRIQDQNNDEIPIIDLLFNFIEKNGHQASFLFSLFKFRNDSFEYLNEKLSENASLIDIEFMKPIFFQSISFIGKKQRESEAEIRRENRRNIESIRSNCVSLFNEVINNDALKSPILNDSENSEKPFSSTFIKYSMLYSIRSIFNSTFVSNDKIQKDNFLENVKKPSKFDILNLLMKENLFSKSSSILLENRDYIEIISTVALIRTKQTKKSIINLFMLIEKKPSLIEFVDSIFPNFFFKENEFKMIIFWIPLMKSFITNNIRFSLSIDGNTFNFNDESPIECKVELIMNKRINLSLCHESKIRYADKSGTFSLDVNDDILIYCMLSELSKSKMKTDLPMTSDEIFHFYFDEASKKRDFSNLRMNHLLSVKDLFESNNSSLISLIWNLVFTLSELEITEISTLIDPVESHLLIAVQKMFMFANSENLQGIINWSKWAEQFEQHIQTISACVLNLNTSYENINSLIDKIGKGINSLKEASESANQFCSFDEIITKCENENKRIFDIKAIRDRIRGNLEELWYYLDSQDIHDEKYIDMKNSMISKLFKLEFFKEEEFTNLKKIIDQFIVSSKLITKEEEKEHIDWPIINLESNSLAKTKAETNQLIDSLIFYSKVKSLLKEIRKTNNMMTALTELNNFPEMINSNQIFLKNLLQVSDDEKFNLSKKNYQIARHSLESSMIMKLYNINSMFITNPRYLCDFINNLEKRNSCKEDDIYWIDVTIKEKSEDFLLSIPKFDPNSLVFLIVNSTSKGNYVAGNLLSDIKDLNLPFKKELSFLLNIKFGSFIEAAKAIGQVFYNIILYEDKIPPQSYEDLKNLYNGPLELHENKMRIIEKLKILFSIADSLENWTNSGFSFNDTFFLSMKWKELLYNETLLNNYPSFLFWICRNQDCAKQIIDVYHKFSPSKKTIPLWLIYLRMITSKQCLRLVSDSKTDIFKIINKAITNQIITYLDESHLLKKKINYDWLNLLTTTIPKKMQNAKIKIFHDFMGHLSFDNLDNLSREIKEKKHQYIKDSVSELTSLILSDKTQELIKNTFTEKSSICHFLSYPSKYIQNKIDQILKDHKKETLFKFSYDIIDISKEEQKSEISFDFTGQINNEILASPILYLSSENEIKSTINKLQLQIGPLFPSLLSDEPIYINMMSFIEDKINLSLDCPNHSDILSIKEGKIMNKMPLQFCITPPKVMCSPKEEVINITGNVNMSIKRVEEKQFPFDITLILAPMKVFLRCIQFPLSKLENNIFRLCCDQVNSGETIDIEVNNYYLPELFKLSIELDPLVGNRAEKPSFILDDKKKLISLLIPNTDKPIRSEFDIIIKFSKKLETKIHCDFVIRPIFFTFEIFNILDKEYSDNDCQVILTKPEIIQPLHFRVFTPYPIKDEAKLSYNFPSFINVKGITLNGETIDDISFLEVKDQLLFDLNVSLSYDESTKYDDECSITLEIRNFHQTIQFKFINLPENSLNPNDENAEEKNNEFLSLYDCHFYSYEKSEWQKIDTNETIKNLVKEVKPYIITTPFTSYTNIDKFSVVNYNHEDDSDLVSNSNRLNIMYVQISDDYSLCVTDQSKYTKTKTEKNMFFMNKKVTTSFYSIIGYADADQKNWFPVLDQYPDLENKELFDYDISSENINKAKQNYKEISDFYANLDASNHTLDSIKILTKLLFTKPDLIKAFYLIKYFPNDLQSKFKDVLKAMTEYVLSQKIEYRDINFLISYNSFITFLRVFKERYQEIQLYQFCLELDISTEIIQERIDKSFAELFSFDAHKEYAISKDISSPLEKKITQISRIEIFPLPEQSDRFECFLVNENADASEMPEKTNFEVFNNEKAISMNIDETVLFLPSTALELDDSISSYMEYIQSYSQGALLLPAFIFHHLFNDKDMKQPEEYFGNLFNLYQKVTKESQEIKCVLSSQINQFINLFRICVNKLKKSGIKFDIDQFQECAYEHVDMISKPENDLPPLQKIEWEDKMNYFLGKNQRPPMSKAKVVRILKNATKVKEKVANGS
ncbi:hypothetical protein M9Y10_006437 [Tritrichomonas musculus]|uniref:Uncharacterized protein n=1 Tax=Tritrichomonas musculus TaxID=1915356 RepID=A0ABR2JF67_9EUKA